MSKISIVYATKTKHSKKLAQAVANALKVPANNIAEKPVLGATDLLFIVGGIYGGKSLPELLAFVNNLEADQIKSVALITSSASKKQGQDEVRKLLTDKGIAVADEIICQGSFLLMKMGHPNQDDIQEAVNFAARAAKV